MKPGREVIEVNFEELTALLQRARQEPLGDADCQRLQGAIQALNYLIEMIGEKDTTISRLRALLAKPSTEKTRKVLEKAGVGATPPGRSSPPPSATTGGQKPKPGHGRNGAAALRALAGGGRAPSGRRDRRGRGSGGGFVAGPGFS